MCLTDEAKAAAALYAAAGFQPTGARGEIRAGLLQSELALELD
jgi:hypothetical protein